MSLGATYETMCLLSVDASVNPMYQQNEHHSNDAQTLNVMMLVLEYYCT
jgi:hypothetical protein